MTEITSIDTTSQANHRLMVKSADTLASYRAHLEANQALHNAREQRIGVEPRSGTLYG
jgi:hypothetical protein